MDGRTSTPTPDELLTHAEWVRRLAYGLVRDAARAEDLVQETWVAALEHPPRHAGNVRAWLGKVVRNAARQSGRAEARRARREEATARREALPSTDAMVAKAVLQREVVDHVLALEEPYRTAVLLRYFEDLPPREIARRTGAPVNTVRTRLQRGLERLRTQLDERHGDRTSWCLALLPLARQGAPATVGHGSIALTLGGWIMALNLKLVLASLFAVVALLVAIGRLGDPDAVVDDPIAAEAVADPPLRPTAEHPRVEEVERAPAMEAGPADSTPASTMPDETTATPTAPMGTVSGRLVDVSGRPLVDRELRWNDPRRPRLAPDGTRILGGDYEVGLSPETLVLLRTVPAALDEFVADFDRPELVRALVLGEAPAAMPAARTDAEGYFELAVDSLRGTLELADESRLLLGHGETTTASGRETWYVAAPAVELAGIVVGEHDRPIADATVETSTDLKALRSFPRPLEGGSYYRHRSVRTDADGRFRLLQVAAVEGARVRASHPEHGDARVPVPNADDPAVRLELVRRTRPSPPRLSGLVVDAGGAPVPGVGVRFGQDSTESDDQGRFGLEATYVNAEFALIGVERAGRLAVLEDVGRRLAEDRRDLADLVLALADGPLAIEGRVLHADGTPYAGVTVDLVDSTMMGSLQRSAESIAAGRADAVTADADGVFALTGLRDRLYRVRARDSETGLVLLAEPVAAGTGDLVLRVPPDAYREHLRGRILSRAGLPIANAAVAVGHDVRRTPTTRETSELAPVRTDANGAFELTRVPRRSVYLVVRGAEVKRTLHEVPEHAPDEGLTITVPILCRFRLHADSPADAFEVLDESGASIQVTAFTSGATIGYRVVPRRDGGFPVCEVTDAAATLLLREDGEEIGRLDLVLEPGHLQVVGP